MTVVLVSKICFKMNVIFIFSNISINYCPIQVREKRLCTDDVKYFYIVNQLETYIRQIICLILKYWYDMTERYNFIG